MILRMVKRLSAYHASIYFMEIVLLIGLSNACLVLFAGKIYEIWQIDGANEMNIEFY